MKQARIYILLRVAVYLLLLGLVLYGLYISPYNPHPSSVEDIRRWVMSFGAWAPLIYVVVYTIRPLLFFPSLLLNLSVGLLFGPWLGIVLFLAGGFGCASLCYALGRFGGGHWLLSNFGGSWGERLTAYLVGQGSFTKMLWLRTVPLFPYDPVSIIAGSVRLPFGVYSLATLIGMLPGAIAYNFLADSFGTTRFYVAIVVTILAFGVPLLLWQKRFGSKGLLKLGRWRSFGK
ncbi:MAG: TVP38/TMEM64 family protein [Phascolarctobacterium sp.]